MERNIFDVNKDAIEAYEALHAPAIVEAEKAKFALFDRNSARTTEDLNKKFAAYPAENLRIKESSNEQILKDAAQAVKSKALMVDTPENEKVWLVGVGKNHNIMEYVPEKIRDDDFEKKAVKENPLAYGHLSIEQKRKPEIAKSYLEGMTFYGEQTNLGGEVVRKPPCQIDKDFPIALSQYDAAMQTKIESVLGRDVQTKELAEANMMLTIADARAQNNPELRDRLDRARDEAIEKNQERIIEMARTQNGLDKGRQDLMDKASALSPDMAQKIEEAQDQYYTQNIHRVIEAERRRAGIPSHTRVKEREDISREEDEKLIKEAEKKIKHARAREVELEYLKQSAKAEIYAMRESGDIEPEVADMSIARLDSIPSVSKGIHALENIAKLSDIANDNHNVDVITAEEMERTINSTTVEYAQHLQEVYNVTTDVLTKKHGIERDPAFETELDLDIADREITFSTTTETKKV